MTQLPRMCPSQFHRPGKRVKRNRMGTVFPLPWTWRIKQRRADATLGESFGIPMDASSRKWSPFWEATPWIASEACFLQNRLFYNLPGLLISHYELRFWQQPGFWGRKGLQPEMFQELATVAFRCYLNHPGRKREHDSNTGSRRTVTQLSTKRCRVSTQCCWRWKDQGSCHWEEFILIW